MEIRETRNFTLVTWIREGQGMAESRTGHWQQIDGHEDRERRTYERRILLPPLFE
jgi:hypothetical protein